MQQTKSTTAGARTLTIDGNSNFQHFGGKPRFLVQAWSNIDGWQDTKHQANDLTMAIHMGRTLKNDPIKWLGGIRKVQIVDREGLILTVNIP